MKANRGCSYPFLCLSLPLPLPNEPWTPSSMYFPIPCPLIVWFPFTVTVLDCEQPDAAKGHRIRQNKSQLALFSARKITPPQIRFSPCKNYFYSEFCVCICVNICELFFFYEQTDYIFKQGLSSQKNEVEDSTYLGCTGCCSMAWNKLQALEIGELETQTASLDVQQELEVNVRQTAPSSPVIYFLIYLTDF